MVEISLSGSGEGPGWATAPGYSTRPFLGSDNTLSVRSLGLGLYAGGSSPCRECHRPRTEVVKVILEQENRLITHLAVDSRCGRELVSG